MEKNVDTSPFRLAIWYWVLYEKGMVHDDYDYSNWSTLNPKVSNYARLVACRPEDVTWQVRAGWCAQARAGWRDLGGSPAPRAGVVRGRGGALGRTTTTWAWTCLTGKKCTSIS